MIFSLEFLHMVHVEVMGGIGVCARLIEGCGEVYLAEPAGVHHLHMEKVRSHHHLRQWGTCNDLPVAFIEQKWKDVLLKQSFID